MSDKVIVLGSFFMDTVFSVPRFVQTGETLQCLSYYEGAGGKGSNQAIAAARSGSSVTFITRIGNDPFGKAAQTLWTDAGIDKNGIIVDATKKTGIACIHVSAETGDNQIVIHPSAANALSAEDVSDKEHLFEGARVFLAQLEVPLDAVKAGLLQARAVGAATILNPAPAIPLGPEVLTLCDYLIPNETEAFLLTGRCVSTPEDGFQASQDLIDRGVKTVIITLGAQGVVYNDGHRQMHVRAFEMDNVIDTTGGGDAFAGAFASALAARLPILEALQSATACAAISVTRRGAAASMPEKLEVEAFLNARRLELQNDRPS